MPPVPIVGWLTRDADELVLRFSFSFDFGSIPIYIGTGFPDKPFNQKGLFGDEKLSL